MDNEMMTFARAIALVRACIPVLEANDASGLGIHMPLSKEQVELLHGIEVVENVAGDLPGGGGCGSMKCKIGLLPSSWGLLTGALRQHYDRQPGVAREMTEHVLQQLGDHSVDTPEDGAGAAPRLREVQVAQSVACFCEGTDPACSICGGTGQMTINRITFVPDESA